MNYKLEEGINQITTLEDCIAALNAITAKLEQVTKQIYYVNYSTEEVSTLPTMLTADGSVTQDYDNAYFVKCNTDAECKWLAKHILADTVITDRDFLVSVQEDPRILMGIYMWDEEASIFTYMSRKDIEHLNQLVG